MIGRMRKGIRMPEAIRMVVFDWDGTLLDSTGHIVESLQLAAERLGWPVPEAEKARDIIGLGMQESIVALFGERSEADVRSYRATYSEIFFTRPYTRVDLFPGVERMLEVLGARGYRLAVATGKSRPGLDRVLKVLDLQGVFEITRCADETRSKPDPKMLLEIQVASRLAAREMVMVGDTTYDLEMAKRASVPGIGVAYGAHGRERLIPYQPLTILERAIELLDVMESCGHHV
ncbi:MAG: HAD family hydrolase [Gammaproteobacteria bacterium]|nr:MAG: HAD family hydrolase [Gammaproteobacteria bacterium]